VRAFRNERQESWFAGLEGAFRHFGGITEEVLFDNDRGLVVRHDRATREVEFNDRLHAFAHHWRFRPRACVPYRARTKGKDERGVGYVKNNAIAGRAFESWSAFEAHLEWWTREIADQRVHGTTGEVPIERFRRAEAKTLRSIAGIPPFAVSRKLVRKVHADCAIEVDGNAYSVPWRLIGERVRAPSPASNCGSAMPARRSRYISAVSAGSSAASTRCTLPASSASDPRRRSCHQPPPMLPIPSCCAR
jgi:hypothetical protein